MQNSVYILRAKEQEVTAYPQCLRRVGCRAHVRNGINVLQHVAFIEIPVKEKSLHERQLKKYEQRLIFSVLAKVIELLGNSYFCNF